MLDDLKYIHTHDTVDALGIVSKQGDQLLYEFDTDYGLHGWHPNNIVYTGMGGSALAAIMVRSWPLISVPFDTVRDYSLPVYTGLDSLVIVSSYSGNTEEALSALESAENAGARIVVIASGGRLAEIAREKRYPLALLPKVDQPRYAVLYNYKALLAILMQADGVVSSTDILPELTRVADSVNHAVSLWGSEIPSDSNPAKQLALELIGRSIVVYGGPKMYPAAYKWKISFNENAKQIAWVNQLPEFNHNEFIGWSKQPIDKPYAVIDLRSTLEHPRVEKRFIVTERLLSGMRPSPHVVNAVGDSVLEQLIWTIAFGDFVSIYTALLNGIDPAPVDLVEKFKVELNAA